MARRSNNTDIKTQTIRVTILAILAGIVTFLLLSLLSFYSVQQYYEREDFRSARINRYVETFQQYIDEHQMTADDQTLLQEWTDEQRYLYVCIYRGDAPLAKNSITYYVAAVNRDLKAPVLEAYVPLRFADGEYMVAFEDYSYIRLIYLTQLFAILLAVLPPLTIALASNRRLSRQIASLSEATQTLERGKLDVPVEIPPDSFRELQQLASYLEGMRVSLRDRHIETQAKAKANQELLTVMSHDIRTPLTTLIGYAEMLEQYPDLSEEERRSYLSIVYRRALRLRELTDEMFYYFLVYGSSELEIHPEEFDAQVLIPQLLSDYLPILQDLGADIRSPDIDSPCVIVTDVNHLNRVLQNVFSNVRKHADLTRPVKIAVLRKEDDYLHLIIWNAISPSDPEKESTQIGLRLCVRLMEMLGGQFRYRDDGKSFSSEILLPLAESSPADTL